MKETFDIDSLPEGTSRYLLEECVGEGVFGKVFQAKDTQAGQKKVAIKIQRFNDENAPFIHEEYKILKDVCNHFNLPDFYGIYKHTKKDEEEIWFVMELCTGGTVMDLVNGLISKNRRMAEEHIAYALKEVIKALIYLHENNVMHRDIRGSNILLTKEGEVKLLDFGLSRLLTSTMGKTSSCLGSPSWMAPETIACCGDQDINSYDNRADVWSLGIVALELANGKSPYQDMHPTRAMFQIIRNPPPTLERPANWSETFNDFINECLVKNPEHRPYMVELIEHPFLTEVPENNYYLTQELKVMSQDYSKIGLEKRIPESAVHSNLLKKGRDKNLESLQVEDLSTLQELTEEAVLHELDNRMMKGQFCTFVGDILLSLNPNEQQNIYGEKQHNLYRFKTRSDNAPHIYSVADSAYQAALHHETPQYIILHGESASGKTTNYLHIVDHLLFLGQNKNINQERIKNGIKLLHAFTHASTPTNEYSTRCIFHTEITYGNGGKNTGAIFKINQIEKWRVSSTNIEQPNFHIMYYFYNGVEAAGELNKYQLSVNKEYRYLRLSQDSKSNSLKNVEKYQKIQEIFQEFEFTHEEIEAILNTLAAIINLGEVRIHNSEDGAAEIRNPENAVIVAKLLKIDEQKFSWALTNYCVINNGTATRRRHSCEEARDARDVLANTLYCRVVQYITSIINNKLSYGRAIFGEKYSIKILDLYGFECFKKNNFSQFLINSTNELLQYHYQQRVFVWEALETNEENIPYKPIYYYNNKSTLNELLGKTGVLNIIDEASKKGKDGKYITEHLQDQEMIYINKINGSEFCVNHYTGKITYDSKDMPNCNQDFLPPEIIEVLQQSKDPTIKLFFSSKVDKFGNLLISFEEPMVQKNSAASDAEASMHTYSQIKHMRTAAATFKVFSKELLKELSIGIGAGGTHFVRCVRSDLQGNSRGFHKEIVKQQLRAMAVLETSVARQKGFPHRIPFPEFLRRYKFLAFDFDENVEINKENCRLLLIRLKMEGWVIGKTRVFLKYYNEEYLSRLYETQVKKVVKIQSMIRTYIARRRVTKMIKSSHKVETVPYTDSQSTVEEEAAIILQKAYRKYSMKKISGNLSSNTDQLDEESIDFIKIFYNKWRAKSIFQVLLQYRAARYQDLYNLSQQVHLYNQNIINVLQQCKCVDLEHVDSRAQVDTWLGNKKQSVLKLPFRLDEIPYFDTSYMCEPAPAGNLTDNEEEPWDSAFTWRETVSSQITSSMAISNNQLEIPNKFENQLIELPYSRNPSEPIRCLSSQTVDSEEEKQDEPNANYKTVDVNSEDLSEPFENQYDESKNKIDNDYLININNTTTSANKDFEYIRPVSPTKTPKTKAPYINPIMELQTKGKRDISDSDDEPPFNFQAMLRKTDYKRESFKRKDGRSRQFSFKDKQCKNTDVDDNQKCENISNEDNKSKQLKFDVETSIQNKQQKGIEKENITQNNEDKDISKNIEDIDIQTSPAFKNVFQELPPTEIVPGVFLEGIMVEL